jgi:hypothetical protein
MAGLLRVLRIFATMMLGLALGLGDGQPMVVVVGRALDVRRGEVVFKVDLRLFLRDLLGGADPATECFPNDLGGLRLGQERCIAKGRKFTSIEKREDVKGLTLRSKVPLPDGQRESNSAKSIDRLSLRHVRSKLRPKPGKYLEWAVGAARNQEGESAEAEEAREGRGGSKSNPETETRVGSVTWARYKPVTKVTRLLVAAPAVRLSLWQLFPSPITASTALRWTLLVTANPLVLLNP